MDKLISLYDFIKNLSKKTANPNKAQAEKDLTALYFEVHNNSDIPFKEKRIKCELIVEQLLYLLKLKNLP